MARVEVMSGSENGEASDDGSEYVNHGPAPGTFAARLDDFATNYSIPKKVTLKSKYLKVPMILMNILVVIYIVIFQFGVKLVFWRPSAVTSQIRLDLYSQTKNFWHCSRSAGDCLHLIPDPTDYVAYPYCKGPFHQDITGCVRYDVADIAQGSLGHLFIMTSLLRSVQDRCYQCSGSIWTNREGASSAYYVAGVEDFLVQIRHSFTTAADPNEYSAGDYQGYIQFKGEDMPRIIPYYKDGEKLTDKGGIAGSARWADAENCGGDTKDTHSCFGSADGDYFSVGTLLKAATGESLLSPGNHLRYHGIVLGLEVTYTNKDPVDFWSWPIGSTMKYLIEPKVLKMSSSNNSDFTNVDVKYPFEAFESSGPAQSRFKAIQRGITFTTTVKGELGRFSFFSGLMAITVSFAITKICQQIINKGLTRVYLMFSGTSHVKPLYDAYSRDRSPDARAVKKLYDEGRHGDVYTLEKEDRKRMLTRIHTGEEV